MTQLTLKDLTLGYEGRPLIRNLNLSVEKGDYLCILGENGSGKTTLMRTILGLQRPLSGEILFAPSLNGEGIGYLPQQGPTQRNFPATVFEIVLSGFQHRAGLRPFYRTEEKQQARDNITRVGLSGFEGRCYRELSGGQQQRVLLARALCASGALLFLDEPAAALDPQATGAFYDLLDHLHQEEGITILMISHDVNAVLDRATHILHLGKTCFFGTPDGYRAFLSRFLGGDAR